MNFIKWLGRVSLWIVLLPVGIWRSVRHGRKQSEARIIDEMRNQQG